MPKALPFDALIVGGGPAGLSAALLLGRCRRKVLLCDVGKPRNIVSRHMHGFLTRDGMSPRQFLNLCRAELKQYSCVQFLARKVLKLIPIKKGFRAFIEGSAPVRARKVLLATGLVDQLPSIAGIQALYGKSVFHCPYCDGWEVRDQALAVYGKGARGFNLARTLLQWSKDVVLLTDGPSRISSEKRSQLNRLGIKIYGAKITRLSGIKGCLKYIIFSNGEKLERRALFFNTHSYPRSPIAEALGCSFNSKGGIYTHGYGATGIPGLYAAGNILRDVQLVVVAAAEGTRAAFEINTSLQEETLKAR